MSRDEWFQPMSPLFLECIHKSTRIELTATTRRLLCRTPWSSIRLVAARLRKHALPQADTRLSSSVGVVVKTILLRTEVDAVEHHVKHGSGPYLFEQFQAAPHR